MKEIIKMELIPSDKLQDQAFEISSNLAPEYKAGDIVICHEIKKELWEHKLPIDEWDFVIAFESRGIVLRQIIHHDVETGEITLRPVNAEGPEFSVNLREVSTLYIVFEHRIPGKKARMSQESSVIND